MRTPRKYSVLLVLSAALLLLLAVGCVREFWRLPAAADRQQAEAINEGAKLYAQNCVACHGPKGEGVVGMPLNRDDLRGDPVAKTAAFEKIYQTLVNGRPGNGSHPEGVKVPLPPESGSPLGYAWLSYTRMPNWSKDTGGPLQDPELRSLTTFIMLGDWDEVGQYIPPAVYEKRLPKPANFSDADYDRVAKLIDSAAKGGKLNCLSCHAIDGRGGAIGPDLSHVGAWTKDPNNPDKHDPDFEKFLHLWLQDPNALNDMGLRMPWFWSADRTQSQKIDTKNPVKYDAKANHTQMVIGKLTDEERDLVVRYLLSLK